MATAKALKHHAGLEDDPRNSAAENLRAIEEGSANLERHILNVKEFGVPCVVAANRFPGDTDEEVALVQRLALELGAHAAVLNEGFIEGRRGRRRDGGGGRRRLRAAQQLQLHVRGLAIRSRPRSRRSPRRIYRADGVDFLPVAQQKIEQFTRDGLTALSICMAKTHLSLSADAALPNAPTRLPRSPCGTSGRTPGPAS